MSEKIRNLLQNWKILMLISLVMISILLVCNVIPINEHLGVGFGNGLDYGLDFAGGVQMQLKLEIPENASVRDTLEIEKGILERRLNAMGLRDITVIPWGEKYILIQVANALPSELERIENIIRQQARFEARIDGELAFLGSEVNIDLRPEGSGVIRGQPAEWFVSIHLTPQGGNRFCNAGRNKLGTPIDMFLDRPEGSIILMTNSTYKILSELREGSDLISDNWIRIIENRSRIPILIAENINLDILNSFLRRGFRHVIIATDEDEIGDDIIALLEENNFTTERKIKGNLSYGEWVKEMIGLKSSPILNCDPCTKCKYNAQITGKAPTVDLALEEMKQTKILLSSGNLPARVDIESKSEIPASHEKFLKYSFIIAIISIIVVAIVIFLRYREPFIVLPIIITCLSEIIIILGVASFINWELDLPAVAGIIAAVGTGVDDQIVITDETMEREKRKKKIISLTERIRRAFFIIFTAAATTIAVMLPIFSIQALKGFAFTTVIGVVIGVFVTRPAYAKIIEEVLRE
ncbi:MAG: hypothetical protein DRO94_01350 [Candidatus Altiarchaeales archaeon]|nr:MAG: hypothetical protein DRO95_00545 [Candidatus Altiarchaeales archaeon]RLI95076.1 MAG: hypothetical protein DRO94_01350 [Candidatus Altiarchaeales archaeon]HDO82193.1 hypothetical protein [Candidatus Altiarchaeales archaeon]HEX54842.1 hypothetical protein [Candidatus Altiarchaeales archaeon]